MLFSTLNALHPYNSVTTVLHCGYILKKFFYFNVTYECKQARLYGGGTIALGDESIDQSNQFLSR